ncbi:MAG: sel1 repeat family protein [Gammaproteobacteria bacterium]|nr:sel1 repeat family protein [Gammaproteobacteria bacterium]
MKLRNLLSAVFLVLAACSESETPKDDFLGDCVNHYRAESFKVALTTCTKAAEKESARAQWLLGNMYYHGLGTEVSDKKAFDWYLAAAQNDWTDAQYSIGLLYRDGEGVEKNVDEGFKWLKKAADNGLREASFEIGQLFYSDLMGEPDLANAIHWFKKAANDNHQMSINNLSWLYATAPEKQFRDAKRAMFWAEKLKINKDNSYMFLDTQAAAYALAGKYEEAVNLQNDAISHLPDDIKEDIRAQFQQRLEAYKNHQAWTEKCC